MPVCTMGTPSHRGNRPPRRNRKTLYEIIEASATFGLARSLTACTRLLKKGIITEETALLYCAKRGVGSLRGIDNIKKERGEITSTVGPLKMRGSQLEDELPAPTGSNWNKTSDVMKTQFITAADKPASVALST